MSGRNDGGPAFPVCDTSQNTATGETTVHQYVQSGLTLRDYFAAKALASMDDTHAIRRGTGYGSGYGSGFTESAIMEADAIARSCYVLADAMLKARQS